MPGRASTFSFSIINQKQKIMKLKKSIFIGTLILGVVGLFSFTLKSNTSSLNGSSYSGEQLFRSLYFMEGKIPTQIPSLKGYADQVQNIVLSDPNAAKQKEEFAKDVIEGIKKINPEFFSDFKAKVTSGNFYEVREELALGGKMLDLALATSKYGKFFKEADKLMSDPQIKDQIRNINIQDKKAIEHLGKLIEKKGTEEMMEGEELVCTPAAAICVYYMIAVAYSQAAAVYNVVGAVNFIGYVTLFVKTKAYFWEAEGGEELAISDKVVKEIAVSLHS
jgi:hypothetical protein